MSLYQLADRSPEELKRFFESTPPDESAVVFYLEIVNRLAAAGEIGYLRTRDDRDLPRLRALVIARSRYDSEHATGWLRGLLDGEPAVMAEAIDGLAYVDDLESAARVMALASHDSEKVRGAVLRYAAQVIPDEAWPLLERAASDPHFIVRQNVADQIGAVDGKRARAVLELLAHDPHADVRESARFAIDDLYDLD